MTEANIVGTFFARAEAAMAQGELMAVRSNISKAEEAAAVLTGEQKDMFVQLGLIRIAVMACERAEMRVRTGDTERARNNLDFAMEVALKLPLGAATEVTEAAGKLIQLSLFRAEARLETGEADLARNNINFAKEIAARLPLGEANAVMEEGLARVAQAALDRAGMWTKNGHKDEAQTNIALAEEVAVHSSAPGMKAVMYNGLRGVFTAATQRADMWARNNNGQKAKANEDLAAAIEHKSAFFREPAAQKRRLVLGR